MTLKWCICATIILIQLKSFRCTTIEYSAYGTVAKNVDANGNLTTNGSNKQHERHHAREGVISDIWHPKTETAESTGRAMHDSLPFPLRTSEHSSWSNRDFRAMPSNHRSDHEPRIIYASSLPANQIAQDRFVPHETQDYFLQKNNKNRLRGAASSKVKESDREDDGSQATKGLNTFTPPRDMYISPSNSQANYPAPSDKKPISIPNYLPPSDGPVYLRPSNPNVPKDDSKNIDDYQPPKELYAFPPNSDANYPPPLNKKPISVSSYLPPPAGPSGYPIYLGPTNPNLIPDDTKIPDMPPHNGPENDDGNSNPVPDMNPSEMYDGNPDRPSDETKLIDSPPPGFMPSKRPLYIDSNPDPHSHDDHYFDSHSPPHHDLPFSFDINEFKHGLHGHDAFPEVIVDHDPHLDFHHDFHHDFEHDHHHFHSLPPPPPPPTTTPPPPPEPEEPLPEEPEEQPRVKKYSYFYLSRTLWYIPLYFTVWFTFYVTWLILQSIGRHKVDLPNHVTSRRSIRDLSHKESVEKINLLTEFVMSQIDDFKDKYL